MVSGVICVDGSEKQVCGEVNRAERGLEWLVFAVCLGSVLVGQFWRGLFFESDRIVINGVLFFTMAVWIGYKSFKKNSIGASSYRIIQSKADVCFGVVTLLYIITCIWSADKSLAIYKAIQYILYFGLYIMARDVMDESKSRWFMRGLVLSAVLLTIHGISAGMGIIDDAESFKGNRLFSALQYPNAYAAYVSAMIFVSLGMIGDAKNKFEKMICGAFGTLLVAGLILSASRGMWLMAPIIGLAYIIACPKRCKYAHMLYAISWGMAGSIGSIAWTMLRGSGAEVNAKLLVPIIASVLMGTILTGVISKSEEKLQNFDSKKIASLLGIIVVAIVAITYIAFTTTEPKTFVNDTDENKWQSMVREIDHIDRDANYKLSLVIGDMADDNEKKAPWIGRVYIQSYDEDNKASMLIDKRFKLDEDMGFQSDHEFEFVTRQDTAKIKVVVQNVYPKTSIRFDQVSILDEDGELVKKVPLTYSYLPESLLVRLNSISTTSHSASARINFYKDGLKLALDKGWLGTGGGGWQALYPMYQSERYFTKLAHNYPLQVWIEIGILGLAALIGGVILIVIGHVKHKSADTNSLGLLFAIITLFAHSCMDFDMSIAVVAMVWWMMLGAARPSANEHIEIEDRKNQENRKDQEKLDGAVGKSTKFNDKRVFGGLAAVICLGLSINCVMQYISMNYEQKGIVIQEHDVDKAFELLERAYDYNPLSIDIGQAVANYKWQMSRVNGDENLRSEAEAMRVSLAAMSPYNIKVQKLKSDWAMQSGDFVTAIKQAEHLARIQPMIKEAYTYKMDVYSNAIKYYLPQQEMKKAAEIVIEKALKIEDEIKDVNEVATKSIGYEKEFIDNLKAISYLVKNDLDHWPKELIFYRTFDEDIDENGKIDGLHLWNAKGGKLKYDTSENGVRLTNDGENYGVVYYVNQTLKPNTKYKLSLRARGTASKGIFDCYVHAPKSEKKTQGIIKDIKLDDEFRNYEVEFVTSGDIVSGKQGVYLRMRGEMETWAEVERVWMVEE